MATTTATQIQQLYVGLLGRAADQGGLNWWADQVTTGGKTLEDVRASFVTSTEYTTTYGAAATRADLVTSIYQNLFERTPSADEVKYWAETDTRPADQLVAAFIEFAGAADQAVINNKTFVAQTYTDTVGTTSFDKGAAAASIANVDGTAASVATATAAIANGTLAGQIPGVSQINALATAQAAVTAFEVANKATADALVAKIDAANKVAGVAATDTLTDNIVAATSSYKAKVDAVVADSALARGKVAGGETTTVLTAKAGDAAKATVAAYAKLDTTTKAQADKLVSAVAAEATAKAAGATAVQKAAVEAGLATDAPAMFGTVIKVGDVITPGGVADAAYAAAHPGVTVGATYPAVLATTNSVAQYATASALYAAYVTGDKDARLAIDSTFKDSAYYSTFKATVVKDAAYADALKATAAATDALDSGTSAAAIAAKVNGITIVAAADTANGTGDDYLAAQALKTAADKKLADAVKADADVIAAKALQDAYAVPNKVVSDAKTAVDKIAVAGKVAVVELNGVAKAGTGTEAAPIKDVFYFADKAVAANAASDFEITSFAAGDSIVLGTSTYTFNNGALSTGNNNALEFFLVKSDVGVQIVLETSVFGSASVAANATTGVIAPVVGVADAAAVITLTGVTAEHVSVANGVISYV